MKLLGKAPVYDLYTNVTNARHPADAAGVVWGILGPALFVWGIDNRLTAIRHWEKI